MKSLGNLQEFDSKQPKLLKWFWFKNVGLAKFVRHIWLNQRYAMTRNSTYNGLDF
jgi:hypothetical protein